MGKRPTLARRKRASKATKKAHRWNLPHLVVVAGVLVALVASIPVGAYLKASVLVAQGTCPAGETGTPPNCSGAPQQQSAPATSSTPPPSDIDCGNGIRVPQGSTCPSMVPQNTVQCPGETAPMHPAGFVCPVTNNTSGTGTTGDAASMQAGCTAAGGTFQGVSANPPCLMPGQQSNQGAATIWCAKLGRNTYTQLECDSAPATGATNSGAVPTMASCAAAGQGWDAVNSRCTSGAMPNCGSTQYVKMPGMTCAPRANCSIATHPDYNTPECQGVRGMMGNSTADCWNEANLARHSSAECTAARAATNTSTRKTMTPPAGMVECPGKSMSGIPMYGRDQNECARMLAEQVKWQSTQNQNNTSGDCWNSSSPSFATQACTAERARVNDAKPMPYMPPMPYAFPGMMNNMNGMQGQDGMHNNYEFMQPTFDQGCRPGDPFCSAYGDQGFDKYKFQFDDMNQMPRPEMQGQMNERMKQQMLQDIKRRSKELEREFTMRSKEVERFSRKSGGLACPAIVKAQSLLDAYKSVVDATKNVTVETVEAAQARLEYVHGGPNVDFSETINGQFQDVMPQLGFCEGIGHFLKEVSRMKSEVQREEKRAPKALAADYARILAEVVAIEKNPLAGIDLEYADPRDLFEKLEDIRFKMEDLRSASHNSHAGDAVCSQLERSQGEISMFLETGDLGEEFMPASAVARAKVEAPKALRVIETGLAACDAGKLDAAEDAMYELDEIGRRVFGGEEGFVDQDEFVDNQIDKLGLEDEYNDETIKRLKARIAELENTVQVLERAVVEVTAKMEEVRQLASNMLSDATVNQIVATTNYVSALDEKVKDEVLANKNEVATVVQEVAANLDAVEGISKAVETRVGEVVRDAMKENWSEAAADDVKEELDSFATFLATNPAPAEVAAETDELVKFIEAEKKEDVVRQVEECHRPFADVPSDAFYMEAFSAMSRCGNGEKPVVFQGTGDSNGLNANPAGTLNGAEAATAMARAFGIQADATVGTRAAGVPEFARGIAGGLAKLGVPEFTNPGFNAADALDRRETAVMLFNIMEAQGLVERSDYKCNLEFKDLNCAQPGAFEVSVLVEEGVFKGNPDGTFAPTRTLNRAEAAVVTNRALEVTQE